MNDERLDEMLMICPEWYNACYASVGDVGYFQEQHNLNLISDHVDAEFDVADNLLVRAMMSLPMCR